MKFLDDVLSCPGDSARPALVQGDRKLSYAGLRSAVERVAGQLRAAGSGPGTRVAVLMEKRIEAVVAALGAMKTGAAYVPLDPSAPRSRLETMLSRCRPRCILSSQNALALLSEAAVPKPSTLFLIDGEAPLRRMSIAPSRNPRDEVEATIAPFDDAQVPTGRSPSDVAVIIFTSGSTGFPKGVMLRHQGLAAFVTSAVAIAGYRPDTVFLNVSPLFFDASLLDVYGTLSVGGTVVLADRVILPNQLVASLAAHNITDTLLVSSLLRLLVSRYSGLCKGHLPHLRTLWYGAEPCRVQVLQEIKALIPQVRFIHGYGPTETTHTATAHTFETFEEQVDGFMPIGRPLPNVEVKLADDAGVPVADGQSGQLFIRGLQVMAGYCDDAERTREVFSRDAQGFEWYKTGDYAKRDLRGNLVFLGRNDDMVKVGGNLVCLLEIEKALVEVDQVEAAVVVTVESEYFGLRPIAFVTWRDPEHALDERALRSVLSTRLPAYMLPKAIVSISPADLPRTPSGKVDRSALSAKAAESDT